MNEAPGFDLEVVINLWCWLRCLGGDRSLVGVGTGASVGGLVVSSMTTLSVRYGSVLRCSFAFTSICYLERLWVVEEMPGAHAHRSNKKWNLLLGRNANLLVSKHTNCYQQNFAACNSFLNGMDAHFNMEGSSRNRICSVYDEEIIR